MSRKTIAWLVMASMFLFGLPIHQVLADDPMQMSDKNPGIMPGGTPGVDPTSPHPHSSTMQVMANAMNNPILPVMDPHAMAEVQKVLDLVPYNQVTHTFNNATGNGLWSDANNWVDANGNHVLPGNDANVLIAAGQTIFIDDKISARLNTVRVDGTLKYMTDRDTSLTVFTMVVPGNFFMGEKNHPIEAAYEAKLTFRGDKDIDPTTDPKQFGLGFLSVPGSHVEVVGSQKTSYGSLDGSVTKGTTLLTLDSAPPTGWQIGDVVVLAGTKKGTGTAADPEFQSEEFLIKAISGNGVTLDHATRYDHTLPTDSMTGMPYKIQLANLIRNATLQSETLTLADANGNYNPNRMGHVMFVHTNDVYAAYFASYNGRTDKIRPLFSFDPNDPSLGSNQVGRYGWHYHMAGTDPNSQAAIAIGGVVAFSNGLGFNNHSSYVVATDMVGYKNVGASFFTEEGDEIGSYTNFLAIGGTRGARVGTDGFSRGVNAFNQSFGTDGNGMWLQAGGGAKGKSGVVVRNLTVADTDGVGFVEFGEALQDGSPVRIDGEILDVDGVTVYGMRAGQSGFETKFHGLSFTDGGTVKNLVLIGGGIRNEYTKHTTFEDVTIYTSGTGVVRNGVTGDNTYRRFEISGWGNRPAAVGIEVPVNGANVIEDSRIEALVGLQITNPNSMNRSVTIKDVNFSQIPAQILGKRKQIAIDLISRVNFKDANVNLLFRDDPNQLTNSILLSNLSTQGRTVQLYWWWQDPTSTPFDAAKGTDLGIPELDGKTAQTLWDDYGLGLAGTLAPSDYTTIAEIRGGGIGSVTTYRSKVTAQSKTFINNVQDYILKAVDANGNKITLQPIKPPVENAWNLITYTIGGQKHTHLVYYDTVPPKIEATPFAINPLEFEIVPPPVFEFKYTVTDKIGKFTVTHDRRIKIDLSKVTRLNDSKGEYFEIMLREQDAAGNVTSEKVRFYIDPNAKRLIQQSPNYAPKTAPKSWTRYLAALLLFRWQRLLQLMIP